MADVLRSPRFWLAPILVVSTLMSFLAALYLGGVLDPRGNLHDLPIAIVNQDEGDTLAGEQRNIGNDIVDGGTGVDRIEGGRGGDALRGAAGNDTVLGNLGDDRLSCGDGRDVCSGGNGRDRAGACERAPWVEVRT